MNSLKRKLIVSIILIILCISNISSLVLAITNEIQENTVSDNIDSVMKNDIYDNEVANSSISNTVSNLVENDVVDTTQIEDSIKQFDVLLAGILNQENSILEYSNIESVISSNEDITEKNGIWIEKNSREYLLKLINNTCNANYTTDETGFLEKDESIENNVYIEKINQLIDNTDSCIVITIEEHYNKLNSDENEIIEMLIEDDEFVSVFENDSNNLNISKVIVLNKRLYNEEKESYKSLNLEQPIEDKEKLNYFLKEVLENNEIEDLIINSSENTNIEKDNNVNEDNISGSESLAIDTPINLEENNEEELNLFDIILSGIVYSEEEITIENIKNVNNVKPDNQGIWIEENSRDIILNFLNNHGAYTYSINDEGYLSCDNVIKNNPNLDFEDVTEVDLEIAYILNEEITLILKIDDRYLNREDGIITYSDLNEGDYVLTFDNDNFDNRLVILNSMYFNDSTEYDVSLSDRFVKKIFDFGYDIQLYSDTSKYGYMTESRNVYFGPSSTDYAKVGSVDLNEKIYLLGKSSGWYHIQYHVGSTGTQKSGYVPVSTVTNIVANPAVHEEVLIGGSRYANSKITIYSCDDLDIAVSVGSVFQGEGVSLLYSYAYSDSSKSYNISFVEYSTSSGTKRGYTYTSNLTSPGYNTCLARITSTSSAYSGPDSSYVKLGGAYYNEYVSVLAKSGNWYFVEYNTSSGRKRGYMNSSFLVEENSSNNIKTFAEYQGLKKATAELNVYGGPNSNYAKIGTIYNQEVITLIEIEREYAYIEYSTNNGGKRGYVINSSLTNSAPIVLPTFGNYTNSEKLIYGTSGLGQDLIYYKFGNGRNVMFVVFAQHGWEDAWAADGIELTKIAKNLIENINSQGISNDWTVYIVPYANPDGITNGYSNNGVGRCTVTSKIDMNRSWPANFDPTYNSRNYTGDTALASIEGIHLSNLLKNNGSQTGATILIDVHGWLDKTYGNADIGQYFNEQFSNSHSSLYGPGYLETWGVQQGYKSCLVELPKPSSPEDIINNNYSGKFINSIRNIISNFDVPTYSDDDGTPVNENVMVNVSPTLNVRSTPSTASTIITKLNYGTVVTRIIRNVTTANGYVWDKIKLADGTEGYVATDYLTLQYANVPIEVNGYFGESNLLFTQDTSWNDISILDLAYDSIVVGEEEYNSMGVLDYVVWLETLVNYQGLFTGGALLAQNSYPNAASALIYFLTSGDDGLSSNQYSYENTLIHPNKTESYSSDHTMREISVRNMVDEHQIAKSTCLTYLNCAMDAAEQYCLNEGEKINFYTKSEIESVADKDNGMDWFLAVNKYRIKMGATAYKTGDNYTMTVSYGMQDYYDWRITEQEEYKLLLSQVDDEAIALASTYLRKMHQAGIARNYTNYGTTTYTITWTKDTNINDFSNVK